MPRCETRTPRSVGPAPTASARLWFITRYEDVAAALRDQRRFVKDVRNTLTEEERAALPPAPELYDLLTHHMLNADGAQHARLRALVGKAFAARRVDQLEPRDRGAGRRPAGPPAGRGATWT